MTRSRLRLATALFTGIGAGCLLMAPAARATPTTDEVSYALAYEQAICGAILVNPTPAGVIAAVALIQRDGWSGYQAGEILVMAVTDACPNQLPVLQRFANRYAGVALEKTATADMLEANP